MDHAGIVRWVLAAPDGAHLARDQRVAAIRELGSAARTVAFTVLLVYMLIRADGLVQSASVRYTGLGIEVLAGFLAAADGNDCILGNAVTEHAGLHSVQQGAAAAVDRPATRPSHHDVLYCDRVDPVTSQQLSCTTERSGTRSS